ncbi:YjgN family protein [Bacteroidota bacterium]
MEIVANQENNKNKTFKFNGKGTALALIYFKNIILTFLTLGIYYPWAKIDILKYFYAETEMDNTPFLFTGKGKDVFSSYLKIFGIVFTFYIFFIIFSATQNNTALIVSTLLFYAFIILILPFAIHGAIRYRASKSSWNSVFFKYSGIRMEFFRIFVKGILLTIITFGIYGSWFQVEIRKYIFRHLKFGNLTFDFKGKGDQLFWIQIKLFLLIFITAGLYIFWHLKKVFKFYIENLKVYQNNEELNFKFNANTGQIALLVFTNTLLFIFTFGLAMPWVLTRTFGFILENSELDNVIDYISLKNSFEESEGSKNRDTYLKILDFDLI